MSKNHIICQSLPEAPQVLDVDEDDPYYLNNVSQYYPPVIFKQINSLEVENKIAQFWQINSKICEPNIDISLLSFNRALRTDIESHLAGYVNVTRLVLATMTTYLKENLCCLNLKESNLYCHQTTQKLSPLVVELYKPPTVQLCRNHGPNLPKSLCLEMISNCHQHGIQHIIVSDYYNWGFFHFKKSSDLKHLQCEFFWKKCDEIKPSVRECICNYIWESILIPYDLNIETSINIIRLEKRKKAIANGVFPRLNYFEVFGSEKRYPSRRSSDRQINQFLHDKNRPHILDFLNDDISVSIVKKLHGHRILRFENVKSLLMEKIYHCSSKLRQIVKIYDTLSCLQGTIVPFLYTVMVTDPLRTNYDSDRSLGLLIEYLDDFYTLNYWLKCPQKPKDWEKEENELKAELKANIQRAVRAVHEQGITHGKLCDTAILICKQSFAISLVSLSHAQISKDTSVDIMALKDIFERIDTVRLNIINKVTPENCCYKTTQ